MFSRDGISVTEDGISVTEDEISVTTERNICNRGFDQLDQTNNHI
jgi:hypothetical protein